MAKKNKKPTFIEIWEKNKNTYMVLGLLFFIVGLFNLAIASNQLIAILKGNPVKVVIADMEHSPRNYFSKNIGSTEVRFFDVEDDAKTHKSIQLPTNLYRGEKGQEITLIKHNSTYVLPDTKPYFFSIIAGVFITLFGASPFIYRFAFYKRSK